MKKRNHAELDRDLLNGPLTEREAMIADAATRLAFDRAGDWLSDKQAKAEAYPGANFAHMKGMAAAYQNAAQEIYGWAIQHQPEERSA
ncbi:hypothetical protein [Magnetospirillum sp. XM-1]|uniref:hypothetical protein n=1 Tax=Magnetospirillum sp. XM-1 TaxID=1663591 RepID=UPI00083805C8|nr:hypothetical protein [Magnetospirillum sp. XM-1]